VFIQKLIDIEDYIGEFTLNFAIYHQNKNNRN